MWANGKFFLEYSILIMGRQFAYCAIGALCTQILLIAAVTAILVMPHSDEGGPLLSVTISLGVPGLSGSTARLSG